MKNATWMAGAIFATLAFAGCGNTASATRATDSDTGLPDSETASATPGFDPVQKCEDAIVSLYDQASVVHRTANVTQGITNDGRDAWFVDGYFHTFADSTQIGGFRCTVDTAGKVIFLQGDNIGTRVY